MSDDRESNFVVPFKTSACVSGADPFREALGVRHVLVSLLNIHLVVQKRCEDAPHS
jgi:hypothetical protein